MDSGNLSSKLWTSSIEVLERRYSSLVQKDRLLQRTPQCGIEHIIPDDSRRILYALNGEHLRSWRFHQPEELENIRSNLKQMVNWVVQKNYYIAMIFYFQEVVEAKK